MGEESKEIIELGEAIRLLSRVSTVEDARVLINLAESARVYARKAELGLEAQNHAAEIKVKAQRKAGEILQRMEKAKGGQPYQERNSTGYIVQPVETYAELGIDKRDAHIWQKIAAMPETVFEEKIAVMKDGGSEITTSAIYREALKIVAADKPPAPPLPPNKYKVIYADPPWKYESFGVSVSEYYGGAERHYPAMETAEIASLTVKELAAEDAVLFLWVTSPKLNEAFCVIDAWGFEYKTSFVWDKVKHNFGHYNSVRHEHLLVCGRGKSTPEVKQLFDSVQVVERTDEHSEKPELFREIIETLYPSGRKIELFARKKVQGWESWGNELLQQE